MTMKMVPMFDEDYQSTRMNNNIFKASHCFSQRKKGLI